jgi:Na+-transporting NADH:ubiquinone oxidoreductase subunit B
MKFVRRYLDRIHPFFAKGGKYERFSPIYEAADRTLYTPGTVTKGPCHVRDGVDTKRIMLMVCLALVPCVFMALWNTGYQANITIHNRKQAQRLLDAGVIQSSEISTLLQSSTGQLLEDNIDRAAQRLVKARTLVAEEPYDSNSNGTAERLKADMASALKTIDDTEDVELSAIGYKPGLRENLLQGLGLSFDPESFWSNVIFGALYFLPVYFVSMVVGGLWELVFAVVRGQDVNEGFLVTGLLFPLTLPPTIPLWQVALGISFGVVISKEIARRWGRNLLNPALTARVFLCFAYPARNLGNGIWTAVSVDGYSGATSLGILSAADAGEGMNAMDVSWWQAFFGATPGSMGETSELACLLGAAVLIATGIASWRIMAGMLIGGIGLSTLLYVFGSDTNPMLSIPPWYHLVIGSFLFGMVFMATDPVSASMTETGRWWYGGLIGALTILIRLFNPTYPEGVMLAILFGNMLAPLIDYAVIQANIKRRLARSAA